MKKKRMMCFLFFAALFLCACGKAADGAKEKDVSMDTLRQTLLAADTTLPQMSVVSSEDENGALNFSYLSDMDYSLVDSYFYAYAADGTAPELAVIRLKDKGDAALMMDALHSHADGRRGTFREYDPAQVELVDKAVVTRQGRYVALFISEKCGMLQKAFASCFEAEEEKADGI